MTIELFAVLGVYSTLIFVMVVLALFFKFRFRIFRNRIRLRIISSSGHEIVKIIKQSQITDANVFKIAGRDVAYIIRTDRMISTGGEQMPTLTYNVDDAEPRIMQGDGVVRSSLRYREVARNRVVSDMIQSFKKKMIDSSTALIITVAVILIATLALGLFVNDKLGKIEDRLPQQIQQIVPTVEVVNNG